MSINTVDIQESTDVQAAALPDYAEQMAAFHRAFFTELQDIVRVLPLRSDMRVLDVGCGDGFYLGLLAERLGESGKLFGLDVNDAYLALAKQNSAVRAARCDVEVLAGSLNELPICRGEFDMVWCAQSLYSFPEPIEALRQMGRAVRPGGLVVVLENDTMHQVFLPWPMRLEIALRAAELSAFSQDSSSPSKFYVGRCLPALFAAAGLRPLGFKTQCIDRRAPLDPDLKLFLTSYLTGLAERVRSRLEPSLIEEFERMIDPTRPEYLLEQPYCTMSWVNVLAWGSSNLMDLVAIDVPFGRLL